MAGVLAFVVYRPKSDGEAATADLVRAHERTLRALGFVTERPFVHGRAKDGSLIEVFEWRDSDATREAHSHPEIEELWSAMEKVCDFPGFAGLEESKAPFANFTPW